MTWHLQIARFEWTAAGETATGLALGDKVIEFEVADPEPMLERRRGRFDGSRIVAHGNENVVDSVLVRIPAEDDAYSAHHETALAIRRALLWQESLRNDRRVVVRFRDDARHESGEWYEAPLIDGRVRLERGGFLRLSWERGPYWSGPETVLKVKNNWTQYAGIVTPDANGYYEYAQITNCDDDDPEHNNWVIIETPGGTVETLVRLRIQNNYDSSRRLKSVRAAWGSRPQKLTLEAEDSEGISPDDIEPDADFGGMAHARSSVFRWTIEQGIYTDLVGRFRVLANGRLNGTTWTFAAGYALTREQYAIQDDGETTATGKNGWTDLGEIVLPPGGFLHQPRAPLKLWLDGSGEAWLDYVALLPVENDQFRYLFFNEGYNCLYEACIEDDGWRGEQAYEVGGLRYASVQAHGSPLWITPAADAQMLSFTLENDRGGAEALRTAIVQVFARPQYDWLP